MLNCDTVRTLLGRLSQRYSVQNLLAKKDVLFSQRKMGRGDGASGLVSRTDDFNFAKKSWKPTWTKMKSHAESLPKEKLRQES